MLSLGGSVRQSPPSRVDNRGPIPNGAVISPPESATSGSDDDELPGHIPSDTKPSASMLKKPSSSIAALEEGIDGAFKYRPQMVRKKSGELVRPTLRTHRRLYSIPGIPLFSKAVQFDPHLERVRHFIPEDRPLAISALSSSAETCESDSQYPFHKDGCAGKIPPFQWELTSANFPRDSQVRKTIAVRLEKVWLSNDRKFFLGSVSVTNLAFRKSVVCRFTLDYWKTVSEVSAEYCHEIHPGESPQGHDRFTFTINLSDIVDLESKPLFFCIRYEVNDHVYWDNNNTTNYQVDFKKKKYLPQNGENIFQSEVSRPLNSLHHPNRSPNEAGSLRHMYVPESLDVFDNGSEVFKIDRPIHEYLGESESATGLRFKPKLSSSLSSGNIAKNSVSPSGAALFKRYDFSLSLDTDLRLPRTPPPSKPKPNSNI